MTTADEFNRRGIDLKNSGRYDEAIACYTSALGINPAFAEVHYNLGLLWRDMRRVDLAIDCLETTVTLRPDVALAHFELANLFIEVHDFDSAVEHYRRAIDISPSLSSAKFNLASVCLDQHRWTEAELLYQQLLADSPADPDVLAGLARALQNQRRFEDAAAAFQEATDVKPDHAIAWTNWGTLLHDQGKLDEAITRYERAIAADAMMVEPVINLGNARLELGQLDLALESFQRAAQLKPDDPRAFVYLGNVLLRLERVPEAVRSYQTAIQLRGDCREAWLHLGHLLRNVGDEVQARQVYADFSRRVPDDPWQSLRAAATCPLVFGDGDEAVAFQHELMHSVRELTGTPATFDFAQFPDQAPECPYNLQFLGGNLRPLKESFATLYADYFRAASERYQPVAKRHGLPRVGFVVTARHETAFLRLFAPVVERLDRRQFETVILCSRLGASRIRAGLQRDVSILEFPDRFDHVVDTIHRSCCDLLYYWEVGNDPTNYFLPFLRLAPIQVTSWGIQVTTGIPSVDAYLSSQWVEHPDAQNHYSEPLLLASTLLTYQLAPKNPPSQACRTDFGFQPDQHLYGCIQNLGKFHHDFDAVLSSILRRDEQGVVVIAEDRHGHARKNLSHRWARQLPDVADRLVFLPPLDHTQYLSLLSACDVLLDPLHFGGVTTTYDALRLAKPVVTLPTEFHRGRYTAACFRKIGVMDAIANDVSDYVNLAVELASDADRRNWLCQRIRDARHVAFEDQLAISEHERIFQELLAKVR